MIRQAISFIGRCRFADAALTLKSCLEGDSGSSPQLRIQIRLARIRCLLMAGMLADASGETFALMIDSKGNNAASLLLAELYKRAGDLDLEALRQLLDELDVATRKSGNFDVGGLLLAQALVSDLRGEHAEAAQLLERAWIHPRGASGACPAELASSICLSYVRSGNLQRAKDWLAASDLSSNEAATPCCRFRSLLARAELGLAEGDASPDLFNELHLLSDNMQFPLGRIMALTAIARFHAQCGNATPDIWTRLWRAFKNARSCKRTMRNAWLGIAQAYADAQTDVDDGGALARRAGLARSRAGRLSLRAKSADR